MARMTCETCGKKPATHHLAAIEGGQKREAHLCEDCARGRFNPESAAKIHELLNTWNSQVKRPRKPKRR